MGLSLSSEVAAKKERRRRRRVLETLAATWSELKRALLRPLLFPALDVTFCGKIPPSRREKAQLAAYAWYANDRFLCVSRASRRLHSVRLASRMAGRGGGGERINI